ncbi:MAG: hypothetical protein K0B06_07720 [Brevefilum sp.]|nr:hypothetical protein [Brevefilum sp.]
MKKSKKQTLIVLTWLSVILCGCPGGVLLMMGLVSMVSVVGGLPLPAIFFGNQDPGFLRGGWLLCLSAPLLLVPIVLVVVSVINRPKKVEIQPIEPTGASTDDPIPPTG